MKFLRFAYRGRKQLLFYVFTLNVSFIVDRDADLFWAFLGLDERQAICERLSRTSDLDILQYHCNAKEKNTSTKIYENRIALNYPVYHNLFASLYRTTLEKRMKKTMMGKDYQTILVYVQ